jgi:hypothetical protein
MEGTMNGTRTLRLGWTLALTAVVGVTAVGSAPAGVKQGGGGGAPLPGVATDTLAAALLDRGLAHMGGRATLEKATTAWFQMMTQWKRTSFDDVPFPDRPSYELHADARDYTIPAWRNTRELGFGPGAGRIVNVVRDSVATTDFGRGQGPTPLSVAYVDERRELFAYTPDRLMLWARQATDLTWAGDTVIAGVRHGRVRATVQGIPITVDLRTADGLPSRATFRSDHPNDFGLVPWGVMDVEVWYSNWRSFPEGISVPTQWDISRAGAPYKRMTVLSADFDPIFHPDSFVVTDVQRVAYLSSPAVRPMHDRSLDSARVSEGFVADFRSFGSPGAALLVGDRWLLLEAGQAPLNTRRALEWLAEHTTHPVGGVVVGAAAAGLLPHGGLPEAVGRNLPVVLGPGAARLAAATLRGYGAAAGSLDVVTTGRWLHMGDDSVRIESLDLPDVRGALVVWFPTQRWLWAPDLATPLDLSLILDFADQRGWPVERIGALRGGVLRPAR